MSINSGVYGSSNFLLIFGSKCNASFGIWANCYESFIADFIGENSSADA